MPPVGQEILVLTSDIDEDFVKEVDESTNGIDIEYTPKSPNNKKSGLYGCGSASLNVKEIESGEYTLNSFKTLVNKHKEIIN